MTMEQLHETLAKKLPPEPSVTYVKVWDGSQKDVYLTALRDVEPYVSRLGAEPEIIQIPGRWAMNTPQLVVQMIKDKGPMTRSALASACNRQYTAVSRSVDVLSKKGILVPMQGELIQTGGRSGQIWTLAA